MRVLIDISASGLTDRLEIRFCQVDGVVYAYHDLKEPFDHYAAIESYVTAWRETGVFPDFFAYQGEEADISINLIGIEKEDAIENSVDDAIPDDGPHP